MRNLSDNEIIKALEYWKQFDKEIDILIKRYPEEKADLLEQREILKITFGVFDLINHLQEENEGLKALNSKLKAENYNFKVKERENPLEMALLIDEQAEQLKTAKAEAYKEFWDELKKRSTLDHRIVSTITGDNLLKELVGDK